MQIRFFVIFITLSLGFYSATPQDKSFATKIINDLTSPEFHGRGYFNDGVNMAAEYIVNQLKALKIQPLSENYLQEFYVDVNTFPNKLSCIIDSVPLESCSHFMVGPTSGLTRGTYKLVRFNAANIDSVAYLENFKSQDLSETFLITSGQLAKRQKLYDLNARGYIFTSKKVFWRLSGSNVQEIYTTLFLVDSLIPQHAQTITLEIEPRFMSDFKNSNVLAKIPAVNPTDSAIVFTAHYDHLGVHGTDCMFPGANDNGSGTAMLLELGKYFIRNPLKHYHVVLMFFAAEEIGLYGSNHYVENPVFPLKNIAALINFDMVGTGSEGISIVNGKENTTIVADIEKINKIDNFFPDIKVGDFSCSSDHCFFARAGVPAIFIFTRGQENQFYHVPDDKMEALPLTKWFELKELVKEFLLIRDDR